MRSWVVSSCSGGFRCHHGIQRFCEERLVEHARERSKGLPGQHTPRSKGEWGHPGLRYSQEASGEGSLAILSLAADQGRQSSPDLTIATRMNTDNTATSDWPLSFSRMSRRRKVSAE